MEERQTPYELGCAGGYLAATEAAATAAPRPIEAAADEGWGEALVRDLGWRGATAYLLGDEWGTEGGETPAEAEEAQEAMRQYGLGCVAGWEQWREEHPTATLSDGSEIVLGPALDEGYSGEDIGPEEGAVIVEAVEVLARRGTMLGEDGEWITEHPAAPQPA